MALILRWAINTLALFVVAHVVPNFHYTTWVALAIAAAVLGLLNALVKPVLFILTLPLTILTVGLFLLVLNAIILEMTAWLVPGFDIDGFGWAILGALLLSVISMFTSGIGKREKRD